MRITRVGGSLLGPSRNSNRDATRLKPIVVIGGGTTTTNVSSKTTTRESFLILPNHRFLTVVSCRTGHTITHLIPQSTTRETTKNGNTNNTPRDSAPSVVTVESLSVIHYPSKTVHDLLLPGDDKEEEDNCDDEQADRQTQNHEDVAVLVGCSDGTIQEFAIADFVSRNKENNNNSLGVDDDDVCGIPYSLPGSCHRPRRIFSLPLQNCQTPIQHLTAIKSPHNNNSKNGVLVFATIVVLSTDQETGKVLPIDKNNIMVRLVRLMLPSYTTPANGEKTQKWRLKKKTQFRTLQELQCRRLADQRSLPLSLLSFTRPVDSNHQGSLEEYDAFVICTRPNSFHVYQERLVNDDLDAPSSPSEQQQQQQQSMFTMTTFSSKAPITVACVSPDGQDLALGYEEGQIRIYTNMTGSILHFHQQRKNQVEVVHPSQSIVVRVLHWHALPVSSLAYHGPQLLYSGGEESVLVTWQLGRGNTRPTGFLPRLAKGGIEHIVMATSVKENDYYYNDDDDDDDDANDDDNSGMVVCCKDNSLQLLRYPFQSIANNRSTSNRHTSWKIQGLSSVTNQTSLRTIQSKKAQRSALSSTTTSRPRAAAVVLTGLEGTPGEIQWFHPRWIGTTITSSLEVVPYNRVSKTDTSDREMWHPEIPHAVFSKSGQELVTVEQIATENKRVGFSQTIEGQKVGVLTTIRFWHKEDGERRGGGGGGGGNDESRYTIQASMTAPHGEPNPVSAVGISPDGQTVCTVSHREKTFRIWRRQLTTTTTTSSTGRHNRTTPEWVCKYKLSIPSGLSNHATCKDGVAFSSDGSIVAIVHGHMVSLWDHVDATLLTTLMDEHPIESMEFVNTAHVHDMVMTRTRRGVKLQSPYGAARGIHLGWSCTLPDGGSVDCATVVDDANVVALATWVNRKASIVLINATTGKPSRKDRVWNVPVGGRVRCLSSAGGEGSLTTTTNWTCHTGLPPAKKQEEEEEPPVRLYVLTNKSELFLLQSDGCNDLLSGKPFLRDDSRPDTLGLPRIHVTKRRRRRTVSEEDLANEVEEGQQQPLAKKPALQAFLGNSNEEGPLETSELPSLSGAFGRSFIGRNLRRNDPHD